MKDTFPLTCFLYTRYITAELLRTNNKSLVAKCIFCTSLFAFFPVQSRWTSVSPGTFWMVEFSVFNINHGAWWSVRLPASPRGSVRHSQPFHFTGTLEHSAEGRGGSASLLLTSAQLDATTHFDFDTDASDGRTATFSFVKTWLQRRDGSSVFRSCHRQNETADGASQKFGHTLWPECLFMHSLD